MPTIKSILIMFAIAMIILAGGLVVSVNTTFAASPALPAVEIGYLLNEQFNQLGTDNQGKPIISGWDVYCSGGKVFCDWQKQFSVDDTSATGNVVMKKKFLPQSSNIVVFQTKVSMNQAMSGTSWQLMSGDTVAVKIDLDSTNINYENNSGNNVVLQSYTTNAWYGLMIVANSSTQTADFYIDGILKASGVAFRNPVNSLDGIIIMTGESSTGTMLLRAMKVWKGYVINEDFYTSGIGTVPSTWSVDTSGGTASVQEILNSHYSDCNSFQFNDTSDSSSVALYTSFTAQSSEFVFEYQFMLPSVIDGITMKLMNSNIDGMVILTNNGDLCYQNSSGVNTTLISSYLANMWYKVKEVVDPATCTADIYINDRLAVSGAAFRNNVSSIDTVRFMTSTTSTGIIWIDDIKIYTKAAEPENYVPTPVPVSTGSYLIGAQTCGIWKEGVMPQWDRILPYEANREPLLGWYDESNYEEMDWEIKWMAEHGIAFRFDTWFRASGTEGVPIKDGFAVHSFDAYMNAKYKEYIKFALLWENTPPRSGCNSLDDFKNNVVPYWIEHYFKNPNYLKIDNKPIVGMISYSQFKNNVGSDANAADAIAYLRQACINAGFAGTVVVVQVWGTGDSTAEYNAGFDYQYTYSNVFSSTSNDSYIAGIKNVMNYKNTQNLKNIAVPSQGWAPYPWNFAANYITLTPSEFQSMLQWTKDTYMPSTPVGSLGRQMLLLDNWNEFGEGHYIMPTTQYGFGYVDAVRNVFATTSSHTDLKPEDVNLGPYNSLYPRAWNQIPISGSTNLALNKTAYMLDVSPYSGCEADKAIDGNTNTYVQASTNGPWSLQVDLGANTTFNTVVIKPDSACYANQYSIDVSNDNVVWNTVAKETSGDATVRTYTFNTVSARYIRLHVTAQAGTYAHAINEFEVYNTNLALNKTTSMNATPYTGSEATKAVDGNSDTYVQANTNIVWDLTVDLGTSQIFDTVVYTPDSYNYASQYTIDVSSDNTTWNTVATETAGVGSTMKYTFNPVCARYVKLHVVAKVGSFANAVREFEVYRSNLCLSKTASTSMNATPVTGCEADKAIDGSTDTYAQANTNTVWNLTVDLGGNTTFNNVIFRPDSVNYASQYTIDVSKDNTNWNTVATETAGTGTVKTYVFNTVSARYVRLNVTAKVGLSADKVQEFEIYYNSNLALNKTATMNATPATGCDAAKAVNGNMSTYAQANTNVLWDLSVDLGANIAFNKVMLTPDTANYAKRYTIDVSTDNISWTSVATDTSGDGTAKTIIFNTAYARYVRLHVMEAVGSSAHIVHEFEVYNTNLALDKTASMNATPLTENEADKAVDGNIATYAQANTNIVWDCTVDLGGSTAFNKVIFTPDSANYASQYTIDVSTDNTNWNTVAIETAGTGTAKTYEFNTVSARYVRLHVTAKIGSSADKVKEFEIYYNTNLALNKAASMDAKPILYFMNGNDTDKAVDGNPNTFVKPNTNTLWNLAIDLGTNTTFDKVVLTQNPGNYASQYTIDVSTDNANWMTVVTETAGDGKTKAYLFDVVSARYVRLHEILGTGTSAPTVCEFEVSNVNNTSKTASMSTAPSTGYEADKAVDGNTSTYAQANTNVVWDLMVDLLTNKTINNVVFRPDATNYASQYTIDVSTDNTNWNTVATETAGNGTDKTYSFNAVSVRYMRIHVTAKVGAYAHVVREFEAYYNPNFTINKTASMNTTAATGCEASRAVDGRTDTYAQASTGILWDLTVDFGGNRTFNEVAFRPDTTNYATQYTIDVSTDNINWTTVATETAGIGLAGTYKFNSACARYVRLHVTAAVMVTGAHALREFEVYSTNIALSKTASMNTAPYTGCEADKAIDGDTNLYAQANTNILWDLTVDLGQNITFNRVIFRPDSGCYASQYTIDVSTDNTNWNTVATETAGAGTAKTYSFDAVSTRYVRLHVTGANGAYAHAVCEFEVYYQPNIAFRQTASMNTTPYTGYGADKAVDGNVNTVAQASTKVPWDLAVDMGMNVKFNQVVFKPDAGNYFSQYTIDVSTDNINWTTVATETAGVGLPKTYVFSTVIARYARIHALAIAGAWGAAVAEFEVYNADIAYNKTASMNATPFGGSEADKAVDGNMATYAQANTDTLWDLTVDLGANIIFNQVIYTPDTSNYASQYTIDVSTDNINWTTVTTETAGVGLAKTYIFNAVNARYVRLHATEKVGSGAHKVKEFQVYNMPNLALKKTASMNATPFSGNEADKAVDSRADTYVQANTNILWDLTVDLGTATTFNKVVFTPDSSCYATEYTIQVSNDNINWMTVAIESAGVGTTRSYNLSIPCFSRYVRLYVTAANGAYAHAVHEFEVYN